MILSYGKSIVGTAHTDKGKCCQDYSITKTLQNGWVIAAIADGVGSAKHSEDASRLACNTFISVCNEEITQETTLDDVKSIILHAYQKADVMIRSYASNEGNSIVEYDTTLSSIVYDGRRMVYGHVGDGGILVIDKKGQYVKVTSPQKAEDGVCVIPLRAGEKSWVINEYKDDVVSILLATDGLYEAFNPYLLKGTKNELYIPLVRWFMDNNIVQATEDNINDIEESRLDFIRSDACKQVTDDKTLVVIINNEKSPNVLDDSYYDEPDWEKLQEAWNKKAYPQMSTDKGEQLK